MITNTLHISLMLLYLAALEASLYSQATVSITATDAVAEESGVFPGTYQVLRSGNTAAPLMVSLSHSGTGVAGTDYTPLPAMITIPAGSATYDIVLDPLNDPNVEPGADTVTVTVEPSGDYTVGSPASATITIADNETFTNTPPLLYAATASSSASIVVRWTDNFETEGKYRVQRAPAGTSSWTSADVVANTRSHTFTGLTAGQAYDFRVVAVATNNTTLSQYSSVARQIALAPALAAPVFRTYEEWRTAFGLNAARRPESQTSSDPDHDGQSNLHEYLFGGDPLLPDVRGLSLTRVPEGAQLTWAENPDILDATTRLEESTTLGAWVPSPLVTPLVGNERTAIDGRGGARFFQLASTTAYQVDPAPLITCWGDSLTGNPGTYVDKLPAALALAGSAGRVTQQGGIGGDISSQILDRMKGLYISAPFPPIAGDTPAATRVIASRTTHSRIMNSASYRGQWPTYAATIANVSRVEFFNFGRKIGESSTPLTASVTSNRAVNATRFLAAGHPFENGFVVHFPSGPLPSPLVVGKPYYVRDADTSAFSLVEADTLVTVTASSAAPSTRYVAAGHPFANGDAVYFPFGGAQSGFVAERYYYVRDADAGGFSLAETVGGPAISMIYNFGPANIKGPMGAPLSLNADFAAPKTLQGPFVLNWSHPGGPTALTLRTHTDRDANTFIFWLGRNNNARPHETYAHLHAAVEHIKALNARFLIVSVTNGANESAGNPYYNGTVGLNWLLKQEFPNEFIDVRTALIRAASSSTQDQNDRIADIPPTSLRSDNIHFNDAGQQIIANILAAEFVRRGW